MSQIFFEPEILWTQILNNFEISFFTHFSFNQNGVKFFLLFSLTTKNAHGIFVFKKNLR